MLIVNFVAVTADTSVAVDIFFFFFLITLEPSVE